MGNLFIQELEADLTKKDNNKVDISSLFRFNLHNVYFTIDRNNINLQTIERIFN